MTAKVEMPSAQAIRDAAHTVDMVICAAEDHALLDEGAIEELMVAYGHLDQLAGHPLPPLYVRADR